MPSAHQWGYFLLVNVGMLLYLAGVLYTAQVQEVKNNWPAYRCNPMYMGFADDVQQNFTYCVQTMQSNFMGHLLQPLTFVTQSLGETASGFTQDIQMVRAMFNKIRTFFSSIIQSIFGVFLNLIIEFQRTTISIRDLMGKTIGILVSLMFIMDGSIKTMNSTWKGPPGQMVRSLGKCFHPETPVLLSCGRVKTMKEVSIGDTLANGARVEATMQIDNRREKIPYYRVDDIYVTGSHLVEYRGEFVRVDACPNSRKTTLVGDYFCCLITSTHQIPVGKRVFWDWEDHFIKVPNSRA
jgi:hypothetical protein